MGDYLRERRRKKGKTHEIMGSYKERVEERRHGKLRREKNEKKK